MELPSTIVSLGTIRPEDGGAVQKATVFRIKLHSEAQISECLDMYIIEVNSQDALSGE